MSNTYYQMETHTASSSADSRATEGSRNSRDSTSSLFSPKHTPQLSLSPRDDYTLIHSKSKPDTTTSKEEMEEAGQENQEDQAEIILVEGEFIIAEHPFSATSLVLPSNQTATTSILSFQTLEVAFIHNVDQSGWIEVTLISNLHRGWVPKNYFVHFKNSYLNSLLIVCGQILIKSSLLNENEHGDGHGNESVSLIQSSVRLLLQKTKTLSRDNDLVKTYPIIRKYRKALLADWYILATSTLKSKSKSVSNSNNSPVEDDEFENQIFLILQKGFVFWDCWNKITNLDLNTKILNPNSSVSISDQIYYINHDDEHLYNTHYNYHVKQIKNDLKHVSRYSNSNTNTHKHDLKHNHEHKHEHEHEHEHEHVYKHKHKHHDSDKNPLQLHLHLRVQDQDKNQESSKINVNNIYRLVYLSSPPMTSHYLSIIESYLLSYFSIILGRIDLIINYENRNNFYEMEILTTQIMLLSQYLIKIVKSLKIKFKGYEISNENENEHEINYDNKDLDKGLDKLLLLLSEFITITKQLSIQLSSQLSTKNNEIVSNDTEIDENEAISKKISLKLIKNSAQLIKCVASLVFKCRSRLEVIKDFRMNNEKKYVDFLKCGFNASDFINLILSSHSMTNNSSCESIKSGNSSRSRSSLASSSSLSKGDHKTSNEKSETTDILTVGIDQLKPDEKKRCSARFSNDFSWENALPNTSTSPVTNNFSTQDQIQEEEEQQQNKDQDQYSNEVLYENGKITAASFNHLISILTSSETFPNQLFVSVFFLHLKTFSTSIDLIDSLITRFLYAINLNTHQSNYKIKQNKIQKAIYYCFKTWLESYWFNDSNDIEDDLNTIKIIINFVNEMMIKELPDESLTLIELLASHISTIIINFNENDIENAYGHKSGLNVQISPRLINMSLFSSKQINLIGKLYQNLNFNNMNSNKNNNNNNQALTKSSFRSSVLLRFDTIKNNALSSNQHHLLKKTLKIYKENSKIFNFNGINESPILIWEKLSKVTVPENFQNLNSNSHSNSNSNGNDNDSDNENNEDEMDDDNGNNLVEILDFEPKELAHQLTILEKQLFEKIQVEEFLYFKQQRSKRRKTLNKNNSNLYKNIDNSLLFTNQLSSYVISSILSNKNKSIKLRTKILKHWIKISFELFHLKNYNSLMSIITSLQSSIITRINKIWNNLSEKHLNNFQELCSIVSIEKNFKNYRDLIKNNINNNCCIIPYIGLFITDLIFAKDGNSKYKYIPVKRNQKSLTNNNDDDNEIEEIQLINFERYRLMTSIIADFQKIQLQNKLIVKSNSINLIASATTTNNSNTTIKRTHYRSRSNSSNLSYNKSQLQENVKTDYSNLIPVIPLQEWIVFEIWKFHVDDDNDKFWRMSTFIEPMMFKF